MQFENFQFLNKTHTHANVDAELHAFIEELFKIYDKE
jgi:hypothetical protein